MLLKLGYKGFAPILGIALRGIAAVFKPLFGFQQKLLGIGLGYNIIAGFIGGFAGKEIIKYFRDKFLRKAALLHPHNRHGLSSRRFNFRINIYAEPPV